jgi:hypothetical protein
MHVSSPQKPKLSRRFIRLTIYLLVIVTIPLWLVASRQSKLIYFPSAFVFSATA